MPVHNADIAEIFSELADLLEIQEANPFRVRAYRTATQTVAALPEAVEARGGQAASSVSHNTEYVVVGERPGSKLADARKVGASILDEQEFRKLLRA